LVLASACSIFLGAPTEKARLIHAPDFPVQFNQQHYVNSQKRPQTKRGLNETRSA